MHKTKHHFTWQRASFICWGLLVLLQWVWHAWWLPPTAVSTGAMLAVTLVPLLFPLVYIARPLRALLCAAMIALIYFCHGIMTAWTVPEARLLALIEVLLSAVVTTGAGLGIKKKA